MKRLACEDCGTVYYSAAAKTLVEQGATCAKCGGRLRLEDEAPRLKSTSARPRSERSEGDD